MRATLARVLTDIRFARGLTLHQPYASAIALGLKKNETRSWYTTYRKVVAIHAGLHVPQYARTFALNEAAAGVLPSIDTLPLGAVVALAVVGDCVPTESLEPTALERRYGDYTPGRWAWRLEDIVPLPEPVPARGYQGIWGLPEDVATRIVAVLAEAA
jgi:hypothetical protein